MSPSGHLQHKPVNSTWANSSTQRVATSRTQAPRIIASSVPTAPQTSSYKRTRIYSGVIIGVISGSCGYTSDLTYVVIQTVTLFYSQLIQCIGICHLCYDLHFPYSRASQPLSQAIINLYCICVFCLQLCIIIYALRFSTSLNRLTHHEWQFEMHSLMTHPMETQIRVQCSTPREYWNLGACGCSGWKAYDKKNSSAFYLPPCCNGYPGEHYRLGCRHWYVSLGHIPTGIFESLDLWHQKLIRSWP